MRSLFRLGLVLGTFAAVAGAAQIAQHARPPAQQMADAANHLLNLLTPEQAEKAKFRFDDPQRLRWFFTPQQDAQRNPTRKGLSLADMNQAQKDAVLNLLKVALSQTGYTQATTIMSLEAVLAELEKNGRMVRDPQWYFLSIFGEPSGTGRWGWRLEGHHLSVNFTLDKGEVLSATPLMFGANPAEIKSGPRKGQRTLPEIEDHAKSLIAALTDEQKAIAAQPKSLPEIKENSPTADVGPAIGLPLSRLTKPQQEIAWKLLEAYARRLPDTLAEAELAKVKAAGLESIRFAYHREENQPGKPYTYRLQGPNFVVEFLNVQNDSAGNPANHIHSAWRRLPADFGLQQ
jgi:hypothetical protein